MADFSAITIGENTYDIKDATARTGLAGKQNTLTAGTGINIVGDVISATGGGGLPDNTITYAQFIQMSDAEQLAFTGYVTDYPGIDDAPVADDVIYDNTDSGLTANNVQDAIDEVNGKVDEIIWGDIITINISIATQGEFSYDLTNEISAPTGYYIADVLLHSNTYRVKTYSFSGTGRIYYSVSEAGTGTTTINLTPIFKKLNV